MAATARSDLPKTRFFPCLKGNFQWNWWPVALQFNQRSSFSFLPHCEATVALFYKANDSAGGPLQWTVFINTVVFGISSTLN